MASDYRISQPLIARLMGFFLAFLGVVVVVLTVAVGLLRLPTVVLSVGLAVAVAVVLLGLLVGYLVTRRFSVVRLDETGYQVRLVRGAGVKQARWVDVEDVVATTMAEERCLVLRLSDGRTTTVPVRALAGSPELFVKDLQTHLNKGHGYRRVG